MNNKKQEKQKMEIANALTDLRESRESLEVAAKALDDAIDEAAIEGQNEYSDDLIEQQVDLLDICSIIKFVEIKSKTDACIANALHNGLKNLPKAMKTCNVLIGAVTNLNDISKQLGSFKSSLSANKDALNKLRNEMLKSNNKKLDDIFRDKMGQSNTDKDKKIQEAKALRAARIGQIIAGQTVPENKAFTNEANASVKTTVKMENASFNIDQAIGDIDKANGEI